MDARHLDDLARDIGSRLPRRSVLAALGGLAALLAAPRLDADARKKNKKKCKGGKKKCGKKCIPADQCCTTADCGSKGECVSGTCVCPAGQKSCNGACIAQAACCQNSDCAGQKVCSGGTCGCPAGLSPCGSGCIDPDFMCCTTADCPGEQSCIDSGCWCEDAIWCGEDCCDLGTQEVCHWGETDYACVAGGCQLFDWCNVVDNSVCRDDPDHYCVCITSYDPVDGEVPACVDGYTIGDDCVPCDDSSECDSGYVCVQGDVSQEDGWCGCTGKFCAAECDTAPGRAARRASTHAGNTRRKAQPGRTR